LKESAKEYGNQQKPGKKIIRYGPGLSGYYLQITKCSDLFVKFF